MNRQLVKLLSDADFHQPEIERQGAEHKFEKFAELIVAEMLQTCEDHPAWTGRMIGEQIKQHFGVKE
jgi:hypothetical protein